MHLIPKLNQRNLSRVLTMDMVLSRREKDCLARPNQYTFLLQVQTDITAEPFQECHWLGANTQLSWVRSVCIIHC